MPTSPAASGSTGGSLELADEDVGAVMTLEFEGVYRDAFVTVNGTVAAHRPYGYSNFFVPIDHLAAPRRERDPRRGQRARRQPLVQRRGASTATSGCCAAAASTSFPTALAVRTPEVDDDGAVVTVAAEVRNRSARSRRSRRSASRCIDADGTVVADRRRAGDRVPGDTVVARRRAVRCRPAPLGTGRPVPLLVPTSRSRSTTRSLDEETTSFGIRSLALDPRRGSADQR